MLFVVNIRVQQNLLAGPKDVLLGQNVFPLTSLKPGELVVLYVAIYNVIFCIAKIITIKYAASYS